MAILIPTELKCKNKLGRAKIMREKQTMYHDKS